MPIAIDGKNYYRTSEAARMAGISRSTLLRWIEGGIVKDESRRDRRGWRVFTRADVVKLKQEACRLK
jgi:DNA-binding transcriptional MerR regulator